MSTDVVQLVPLDELPLSKRVAANIRAEMARYGVQQSQVASLLGLSQPAVSQKLRGNRPVSLDELDTIAEFLDIEVADLVGRRRNPHQDGPGGGRMLPRMDSNHQPSD